MQHTSELFTETANFCFQPIIISTTTGPIYTKFTYFIPSKYTTSHTKFEENTVMSNNITENASKFLVIATYLYSILITTDDVALKFFPDSNLY